MTKASREGSGPASGESERSAGRGASTVASGILASRLMGFVREASLAFFFGAGPHSDVFRTALRGPNLIQNLLGEQTLSAAFIPIYSRLVAEGRDEDAGRFAGAIFGLLLALTAVVSAVGVLLAEPIVAVLAPGYLGDAARISAGVAEVDRYPLAVAAVKIIFPMTALLVLSAWSLGILNSHRRFFLPYFAPVLWNASIIAALWWIGPGDRDRLLLAGCIGALVGGGLQFLVQLPLVARVLNGFRFSLSPRVGGVKEAIGAFAPLTAGRGAVQLSSYLDQFLASFLAAGALAALGWAQILYILPISLFGMSVAAAELPELAVRTDRPRREEMRLRLEDGLRRMLFLTVPTVLGYLLFGFLIVGGLYRRGSFRLDDNWLVYLVLCGYTVGLLASNSSRVVNNVFFALGKTAIPARIAIERVVLSGVLGTAGMLWLDRYSVTAALGLSVGQRELRLGALGLALAAGVTSWYELARLARALGKELPSFEAPLRYVGRASAAAAVGALPALAVWYLLPDLPLVLGACIVLAVYALSYFAVAKQLGLDELQTWLGAFSRRRPKNRGRGDE